MGHSTPTHDYLAYGVIKIPSQCAQISLLYMKSGPLISERCHDALQGMHKGNLDFMATDLFGQENYL